MNAFTLWARRRSLFSDTDGGHVAVTGMEIDFRIVPSITDGSHRLLIFWGCALGSYPMERRDA